MHISNISICTVSSDNCSQVARWGCWPRVQPGAQVGVLAQSAACRWGCWPRVQPGGQVGVLAQSAACSAMLGYAAGERCSLHRTGVRRHSRTGRRLPSAAPPARLARHTPHHKLPGLQSISSIALNRKHIFLYHSSNYDITCFVRIMNFTQTFCSTAVCLERLREFHR